MLAKIEVSLFICAFFLTILSITCSKTNSQFKFPVIVWWTNLLYPHLGNQNEISCSLGKCISTRKQYYKATNESICYLFYGTDFDASDLPLPRKKKHAWALLHEESPMNNYIFSHLAGITLFNYTSTFSRYSDFPLTTQFIPSLDYLTSRKPVPTEEKNAFRKNGIAPIMYLQSHCDVASYRDQYVEELMKFIDVDSYGSCLKNRDLPSHLTSTDTHDDEQLFDFISKYKFHIAYENALCDDYMTEKLFRALHVGSVPIYKGSATAKDWIPDERSVVFIDDFSSPEHLAQFISRLDSDDGLYKEYLQFKREGVLNDFLKKVVSERKWGVNDPEKMDAFRSYECFLCDKMYALNNSFEPRVGEKKHMNCFQPHLPLHQKTFTSGYQEWIENYWYSFDLARAVQLVIQNKDKDTTNLMKYISQLKYKH